MTKTNPDYTASAVNLTNPTSVSSLLAKLRLSEEGLNTTMEIVSRVLEIHAPHLADQRQEYEKAIAQTMLELRSTIEADGSYQDTEAGIYGLKQRKVSKEYHAEAFEARYPRYAGSVIIKAVDVPVLQALIKGGQLNEETLKREGPVGVDGYGPPVITEKESFAFIIKSGFAPPEPEKKGEK